MRVICATPALLLAAAAAACAEKKPPPPPVLADAAPPAVEKPVVLAPVEGASADLGKARFAELCGGCHGGDARGAGPDAARQPFPPTDLTHDSYLCRSTFGRDAVPSDADLEEALGRGAHAKLLLDPVTRRSMVLHVKTLAPGFARKPAPLLAVPPEPADTPEDRARGRTLYLALGCWVCHGPTGGGEVSGQITWNGTRVEKLPPLAARSAWLCGEEAPRVYLTIALGMGTRPAVMPEYLPYARNVVRPDGEPDTWTRKLEGKVPAEEIARVRAWFAALPPRAEVHKLDGAALDARAAATIWSLVHYVRAP